MTDDPTSSSTTPQQQQASLIVAPSKEAVANCLNAAIVQVCVRALAARGTFTIALSGGSLPSFLSTVNDAFQAAGVQPQYERWHVILADERCVPLDHPDSNMKAIRENFLSKVSIPESQCHAIDETILKSTESVADAYQKVVEQVLKISGGLLDLALLGFGPDGHTCSLFPGHALLSETTKSVAFLEDSPKPPPQRITLTLRVLNAQTRHVVFCGAGASKSDILQAVFSNIVAVGAAAGAGAKTYRATLTQPPPYPCAMVAPPTTSTTTGSTAAADLSSDPAALTWVVDADAMEGVGVSNL